MNKFFVLTKVLLKNSISTFGTGKSSKRKTLLYFALIVMGILPMIVGIGTSTATMYDVLVQIHQEGILLATGFTTVNLLILVFGIFYVINIFYFAQDIDRLLPLPLRPSHLISAKFCVTLIFEYLTVVMFLLPIIIVFGIKSSGGLLYWIYSFLLLLAVPVIPMVTAGIIVMILMRFSNLTKRKDQFRILAAIFGILLVLVINFFISNYLNVSDHPEKTLDLLKSGNNIFIDTVTKVFPTAKMAAECLLSYNNFSGFTSLFMLYLINAAFVFIFLILGEAVYLKGAVGSSEVYSEKKLLNKDEIYRASHKNTLIKAGVLKELRILFRTPAFFINCILTNFLWPVILGGAYLGVNTELHKVTQLLYNNNMESIIIACAAALSMFISASNSIAASAFSREGTNFFVYKYIPASYSVLIKSKFYSGVIISFAGFIFVLITAGFLLKLEAVVIVLSVILSLPGIILIFLIGLILDINYPKLTWDNEYKPIKQNMNVLISIMISVFLGAILSSLGFILDVSSASVFIMLFVLLMIVNYVLYKMLLTKGIKAIMLLEV